MESHQVLKLGFYVTKRTLTYLNSEFSEEKLRQYLSSGTLGRLLLTFADYFIRYSKQFDKFSVILTDVPGGFLNNVTAMGVVGQINRSEVDIDVMETIMTERLAKVVDFAYPFSLSSITFATRKPEYKPQVFGILQTFSLFTWIAIFAVLIVLLLIYYSTLKQKYPFSKIFLHVIAILFRQSSILRPSSAGENLLVYAWVVGAMFLCLAYESVFLSFLTFPPITQVKDVPQLAKAVEKGIYHCVAPPITRIPRQLSISNNRNLRIIGTHMLKDNLRFENHILDFVYGKNKENIAFLISAKVIDNLAGTKFVSEDRFLETMGAMMIRKNFCCKASVNKFVHRMMASGLYFKNRNDGYFLLGLQSLKNFHEEDNSKRKLTLTDVAPAFMFLTAGWLISSLVLVCEKVFSRGHKLKRLKRINKRKKKVKYNDCPV